MARWLTTYAKYKGTDTYRAFDINEGRPAGNILYATQIKNTRENRAKLNRLAKDNAGIGLSLELRDGNKTVYSTDAPAKKGKSSNDIIEQSRRLLSNPNISNERAQRVVEASTRYVNNIGNKKAFARDINQGRGFEGARDRIYSRNSYMGTNAG